MSSSILIKSWNSLNILPMKMMKTFFFEMNLIKNYRESIPPNQEAIQMDEQDVIHIDEQNILARNEDIQMNHIDLSLLSLSDNVESSEDEFMPGCCNSENFFIASLG